MATTKTNRPSPDNEIEELAASRKSGSDSSPATMNKEKLAQEQEGFRIISEDTENSRQDQIENEELIGSGNSRSVINGVEDDPEGNNDLEVVMGNETDVTEDDLVALGDKDQDMDMGEDELIAPSSLDNVDEDGDPLNEGAAPLYSTGDDLDTGDADMNKPDGDAMGQGDEENSYYSLGGDKD